MIEINYEKSERSILVKKKAQLEKYNQKHRKVKRNLYVAYIKKFLPFNSPNTKQLRASLRKVEKNIDRLTKELIALEKGAYGEKLVTDTLKESLNDQFYLISNYTFQHNGTSYEIDHIVIGPTGIFFLEAKNLNGRIFVFDEESKWLKTPLNNPDALKVPFKNPQFQLSKARDAFFKSHSSEVLDTSVNFAVVFPRNSCLLLGREQTSTIPVLYNDEVSEYIQSYKESLSTSYIKYWIKMLIGSD
ncbi:nuclease-related domain-containing protein [Natranaerobius trueperi]|uniref:NERD domain-containing protein n=1 Tax=Natranaerobius trueperi TaxID=759412 RepID=A0A226C2X2_9FIRM|nr:nuclease-related domain-containing protein [Natranaerobius trueperi]OWZ84757.1 hypothetical protein CDO51_01685 [Natranaerobius trueperi]